MQLPRRVPWATLVELDQLCSWVYSEDVNGDSRIFAIERLSAWKFMMPLPHALESLLSLLVAIRQDEPSVFVGLSSSLSLRQSYATAIIRLVNGLVDPLQMGTYARSIQSIATQIGLPAWLVELRHAATHEDLPSLELLRDGAKESLTWLLHNYFLPTLNPTFEHALPRPSIRPLEPLLRRYKNLLKMVSRDASLRPRHEADISSLLREIERWVSEARVAADAATNEFAWQSRDGYELAAGRVDGGTDEPEPREIWALDRLCEALLTRGMLVPISRKKRVSQKGSHYPPPPLLAIWIPLLESLIENHANFHAVLISHVLTRLIAEDPHDDENGGGDDAAAVAAAERASYDVCLAAWGAWLIEWRSTDETDVDVATRREAAFFQLVQTTLLGRAERGETSPHNHNNNNKSQQLGARALLTALGVADRRLAEISANTKNTQITSELHDDSILWREADLDVMEARLKKAVLSFSPHRSGIKKHPAHEQERRSSSSATTTISKIPRLGTEETTWCRPSASRHESSTTTTVSRDWQGMEEDEGVAAQMGVPGVATETESDLPDGWRLVPTGINGRRPCPPMGVFID